VQVLYDWGLSGYNTESLTMDHSGQHVLRVTLSLHFKEATAKD